MAEIDIRVSTGNTHRGLTVMRLDDAIAWRRAAR